MQRRLNWCYDFLFSNTDYQFSQAVFKHREKEIHDNFKGSYERGRFVVPGHTNEPVFFVELTTSTQSKSKRAR